MRKTDQKQQYFNELWFKCMLMTAMVLFGIGLINTNAQENDAKVSVSESPEKTSFEYFEILFKNNVFDPNRRPYVPPRQRERREVVPEPVVETFKLGGVMSYDGKSMAYFQGTSRSISGIKGMGEMVENLKLAEVLVDQVVLRQPDIEDENKITEEFKIKVGQSLTRTDGGEWKPFNGTLGSGRASSVFRRSSTSENNSASDAAESKEDEEASESENDILKMLMERRKKEMGE